MNNSFDVEFVAENSSFQAEFSGVQVIGGGGTIIVDDAMSNTSTNPVQNKVVTQYVQGIVQGFESWANQTHEALKDEVYTTTNDAFRELSTILVFKENGKGLSTNDFTNEDKAKLDNLEEYLNGVIGGIENGSY